MLDGANLFDGLVTVALGGVSYFVNKNDTRIKKNEDLAEKTHNELADHKLDCEKRYAKEESMQACLSRLHDRIDTIGTDIKTILVRIPK